MGDHRARSLEQDMDEGRDWDFAEREIRVHGYIPKFLAGAISCALTGLFALAGAFSGAIAGALAGRASECGVLRGAGLGAAAGAVISMEILEASRAYWCSERSGFQSSSSMADFIEELLHRRLAEDRLAPGMLHGHNWQVSVTSISFDEMPDAYDEVVLKGLPEHFLRKLPCYMIQEKTPATQSIHCTICLQDLEAGEIARSLPRCNHTFHRRCIDQWLVRHGLCPVCRQDVEPWSREP